MVLTIELAVPKGTHLYRVRKNVAYLTRHRVYSASLEGLSVCPNVCVCVCVCMCVWVTSCVVS
jgi:hypothetical protein